MKNFILDTLEMVFNHPISSYLMGAPLVEYGLSRWHSRPFSRRNVVTIFIITFGAACIIRGLYLIK